MNGSDYGRPDGNHNHGRGRDDRDSRRRSRSPRRGGGGGRREYDRNDRNDPYMSSRDFRERQREDNYRERRDDRGDWSRRDGGGDHFHRRDRRDDGRPPRRGGDRDLFDDRRGGGGSRRDDDRRGHGGGHRAAPRRSESPRPRRREPTPDLTNVVSILDRKRRQTNWDIKPPGFENVSAEQAKLSGMFSLPGAPRQQTMDPARLQALTSQPADAASKNALSITQARQSRRLFVTGFPKTMDEAAMKAFWNLQLNDLDCISAHDPCVLCKMSPERHLAMIEFRTPEDGTLSLALDGIVMEDHTNGVGNGNAPVCLSVQRPDDYIVPVYDADAETRPNVVLDGPEKLMITGIDPQLPTDTITQLITAFGPVKAQSIPKDRSEQTLRGMAFVEYADEETTKLALENLHDVELAGRRLSVKRTNVGIRQAAGVEQQGVAGLNMLANMPRKDTDPKGPTSRAICLYNLVDVADLNHDEDYEDLKADVLEELEKYGKVVGLKIPRPTPGHRDNPGIGKAYAKYDTLEEAGKATESLSHRVFDSRTVLVAHFGEQYYEVEAW